MNELSTWPAAILWDLDGTIIDTDQYWYRAHSDLVAQFGGSWTVEADLGLIGAGPAAEAAALQQCGVQMEPPEILAYLNDRVMNWLADGIPWRPGARSLLEGLFEVGIPMGLVTMSLAPITNQVLGAIGFEPFDVVITGSDVAIGKPDPEPYRNAIATLNVEASQCIALEDSPAGVESALAAGAIVIGVPHNRELDPMRVFAMWQTLKAKTVSDLRRVYRDARSATCGEHLPLAVNRIIQGGHALVPHREES